MPSPSLATVKRLFAMSGNRCAFPECSVSIFQESGTLVGEVCHIKANRHGGPRYDLGQSEQERQDYENLILLCCNHHEAVDAQDQIFTAEVLSGMKAIAEKRYSRPERSTDETFAAALLHRARVISVVGNCVNVAIDSPGAIQAQTVVLKSSAQKTRFAPPPGTIGSEVDASRYVTYLIGRYQEFAKGEPSRGRPFSFAVIFKSIEREFGAKWQLVPMRRFEELCAFLQEKISNTRVGRLNRSKVQNSYSDYEAYLAKHG